MSQKCFSNEVNSSAAVAPCLQCVGAVAMLLCHDLSVHLHGLSVTPQRLLIMFSLRKIWGHAWLFCSVLLSNVIQTIGSAQKLDCGQQTWRFWTWCPSEAPSPQSGNERGFSACPQDLLLPRHSSMVICFPHDTACWTLASINSGSCKHFSTQHLLVHVSVAGAYRTLREFAMTGDIKQHAQAPLDPVSTSSPTTFSYHKRIKKSEKRCGFEWHPLLSLGVELPPFLHTCWRESAQISGSLGWAAGPKMFLTSSQLPVSGLHLRNSATTLAHSPWTHFPCLLPS